MLADCPKCGYALQPFDTECPRCARLGTSEAKEVRQTLASMAQPSSARSSRSKSQRPLAIVAIVVILGGSLAIYLQLRGSGPLSSSRARSVFALERGQGLEPGVASGGSVPIGPAPAGSGASGGLPSPSAPDETAVVRQHLKDCPFEIQAGSPVRLPSGWQGEKWGVSLELAPQSGGTEGTASGLYADDWGITAVGGGGIVMDVVQNDRVQLTSGAVRREASRAGGATPGGDLTVITGDVGYGGAPMDTRFMWRDQPFEVRRGGTVVATFQSAAEYAQAVR